MKWIKVSQPPKEDCEVPIKVFSHRLQRELFRIGIFQRGIWTIREKYGPEDVIEYLDESNEGEERKFSLKEALEIHTAGVIEGNRQAYGKPCIDQKKYFKDKFNISI